MKTPGRSTPVILLILTRTEGMGEGFQFLDIILFALVAGFLILRLRSVLGRRDGHQGRGADPFTPQPKPEGADDKVVRLPDRGERPVDAGPVAGDAPAEPRGPVATGIAQIRVADPRFDANEFLSGSRIAFELILNAFSAGDAETLKPLLSPDVYANFEQSIREREESGERLETKLVGIASADIVEAYMAGRTAHVTVKFVSEQVSTVYDAAGQVVEGSPDAITEVVDTWTFARDTRSPDPNWILVATGSVE